MNLSKIKKIVSVLFISLGTIALIVEISSENKNYYIQSVGIILLMLGLFMVNTKVKSKTEISTQEYFEEE